MAFKKYSSIFTPVDLEIIQNVFDQLCSERRLALKDREQREQLANEVIQAFENRISDEVALRRLFSKRRRAMAE
ncbi:hypothetical protein [Mesorhizobium sp. M4A.F.Ca.ET.022.05.2.1]|uniref:hypothetical protein n=1 Tax=Mesorhizobium sp. M4A.F.Ca.ET.022.05.2.1 TaxID=2496653 RepID=UPI00167BBE60|nr:hypothetical protein [Mesorhizobium sp. M4A.F.Ca.ET.022.05.2.1]